MFYTYILYSEDKDRYYTGHTSNFPLARLDQHNNGMNPSTKYGIPWNLVFYVHFEGKSDAIRFENFIKSQKSKAFIEFYSAQNKTRFGNSSVVESRSLGTKVGVAPKLRGFPLNKKAQKQMFMSFFCFQALTQEAYSTLTFFTVRSKIATTQDIHPTYLLPDYISIIME